jgi:hypothetical protein
LHSYFIPPPQACVVLSIGLLFIKIGFGVELRSLDPKSFNPGLAVGQVDHHLGRDLILASRHCRKEILVFESPNCICADSQTSATPNICHMSGLEQSDKDIP